MMPISISMMILGAQLLVPVADNVPKFDMARSCKLDLAAQPGSRSVSLSRVASMMSKGRDASLVRSGRKCQSRRGKAALARRQWVVRRATSVC